MIPPPGLTHRSVSLRLSGQVRVPGVQLVPERPRA
jgi:hypothetical protein